MWDLGPGKSDSSPCYVFVKKKGRLRHLDVSEGVITACPQHNGTEYRMICQPPLIMDGDEALATYGNRRGCFHPLDASVRSRLLTLDHGREVVASIPHAEEQPKGDELRSKIRSTREV